MIILREAFKILLYHLLPTKISLLAMSCIKVILTVAIMASKVVTRDDFYHHFVLNLMRRRG